MRILKEETNIDIILINGEGGDYRDDLIKKSRPLPHHFAECDKPLTNDDNWICERCLNEENE